MSSRKGFRTGSNSYGQFWFGGNSFPGFLYKKNVGVGGRRSTRFTPGGTTITNQPNEFWNKYKPGNGGVGASSVATRRAKMRLATVCDEQGKCGNFYKYLGLFDNYTGNGLKALYPYLTEKQLLILIYLLKNRVPYEDAISTVIYPPVFLLNSEFIPDSDMPAPPDTSTSGNMVNGKNTYVSNWFYGSDNGLSGKPTLVYNTPCCGNDYTNYQAWLGNAARPPNYSNIIAFQSKNTSTSDGVYLYQILNSTLYNNISYKLTFYTTNRSQTHYDSNPSNLHIYFKINNQIILTNYNPASTSADNFDWKFISISFTWNYPTISNPIFQFGQVNTTSNDLTIFVTQPSLSLDVPV